MKRTILSRTYILDTADTRHTLNATSAADLAAQVQEITSSRQFGHLARAAWGDSAADLRTGGIRLVATGATVREVWRTLAPLMSKATVNSEGGDEGPASEEPAQEVQHPANPEGASEQPSEQRQSEVLSDVAAEVDTTLSQFGAVPGGREEESR